MRDVDLHVGQDMPELKPVETGPLPPQPTEVASPVEEAGTIRHETGAGSPRPSVVGGCHKRQDLMTLGIRDPRGSQRKPRPLETTLHQISTHSRVRNFIEGAR